MEVPGLQACSWAYPSLRAMSAFIGECYASNLGFSVLETIATENHLLVMPQALISYLQAPLTVVNIILYTQLLAMVHTSCTLTKLHASNYMTLYYLEQC